MSEEKEKDGDGDSAKKRKKLAKDKEKKSEDGDERMNKAPAPPPKDKALDSPLKTGEDGVSSVVDSDKESKKREGACNRETKAKEMTKKKKSKAGTSAVSTKVSNPSSRQSSGQVEHSLQPREGLAASSKQNHTQENTVDRLAQAASEELAKEFPSLTKGRTEEIKEGIEQALAAGAIINRRPPSSKSVHSGGSSKRSKKFSSTSDCNKSSKSVQGQMGSNVSISKSDPISEARGSRSKPGSERSKSVNSTMSGACRSERSLSGHPPNGKDDPDLSQDTVETEETRPEESEGSKRKKKREEFESGSKSPNDDSRSLEEPSSSGKKHAKSNVSGDTSKSFQHNLGSGLRVGGGEGEGEVGGGSEMFLKGIVKEDDQEDLTKKLLEKFEKWRIERGLPKLQGVGSKGDEEELDGEGIARREVEAESKLEEETRDEGGRRLGVGQQAFGDLGNLPQLRIGIVLYQSNRAWIDVRPPFWIRS
ncbi:hypothetical protein IE53DRAFT_408587 [Violaceomyces palustris]|uniref:Uncharacterized protein n=1 Tax=Violaceomyces palustris TaxID=1673888 RepID=A0ACD0P663_9BASI|nr:hypothetical protein IE53DRAFT_408587 [Violaceomyces palustris]